MRASVVRERKARARISMIGGRGNVGGGSALPLRGWRTYLVPALRQALPMAAGLILILILLRHLDGIDGACIRAAVAGIGVWQWSTALAATALSYWAIGHYDLAMHRHFRSGTTAATALRAGRVAIALGQLLGFGPLVGSLVRWRMLPGFGPGAAMRLSVAVSLSFIAAMAVVLAFSVAVSDLPLPAPLRWSALAIVAACPALIIFCAVAPDNSASWVGRMIPGVAVVLRILAFTCIDLAAAGAALWVFLPAAAAIPPADLLAAFMIATMAGLVLSTPGGIGTFELLMIALLPAMGIEELLAAILCYRVAYFLVPGVIAAAILILAPVRPARHAEAGAAAAVLVPPGGAPMSDALRRLTGNGAAEALVCRQGAHGAISLPGGAVMVTAMTCNALIGLFDPAVTGTGDMRPVFDGLARAALDSGRAACLYRISQRAAAVARRAGWRILPTARAAVLRPAQADLSQPACAQLRRKLRRATRAGVAVTHETDLPIADMTAVAADWTRLRGAERGFSMGRYDPAYVAGQRVYLARLGGRLVGFATFHVTPGEWALDLMRHGPDMPEGTMHALVAAALADAARLGVPRLSLSGLPPGQDRRRGFAARMVARGLSRLSGPGLHQFKAAFAPTFVPQYIAAPRLSDLIIGAITVAIRVRWPGPPPVALPVADVGDVPGNAAGGPQPAPPVIRAA
jgi:phosphatidylglycerol lysyltransferase